MKKYVGSICVLALLACGSNTEGGADVNGGETSSLVAGEATERTANNFEQVVEPVKAEGVAQIEYMETEYDFGNVVYPSENLHTFKFKNTGNVPLIIESAKASCGCTVPNKPEEPIMPGEVGELDVIFRPKEGQMGHAINKKITVTANTEPKQTYLNITADVLIPMNAE